MKRNSVPGVFLTVAGLLISACCGCASFKNGNSFLGSSEPKVPTAAAGTPAVGLRFIALDEQAEVFNHFKKMKITLRRIVPETQVLAKMQVSLEEGKRQVALGSDYAMFERDILEVTEENSDWGTEMLRSALGPLGTVVLPE